MFENQLKINYKAVYVFKRAFGFWETAIIHTSTLIEGNKFVWKIKPAVFFLRLQFDNESKSE